MLYIGKKNRTHQNSASVLFFPFIFVIFPLDILDVWWCTLPIPAVWLEGNQNRPDFLLWITGPEHPLHDKVPEYLLADEQWSISQRNPHLPISETCLFVTPGNSALWIPLMLLNMLMFQVQHPDCWSEVNEYRFLGYRRSKYIYSMLYLLGLGRDCCVAFSGHVLLACIPKHQASPKRDQLWLPDNVMGMKCSWVTGWSSLLHLNSYLLCSLYTAAVLSGRRG